MPQDQSSSQPASEWSPSMNTTSTSPCQRAASSWESSTCQCTLGAIAPRRALSAREDAPGRPLGGAPSAGQRVGMGAEGIDQMQLGVRPERLAQRQRRGALVDPDLDHPLARLAPPPAAPARPAAECIVRGGISPSADRQRAQAHVVAQAHRASDDAGCGEDETSRAHPTRSRRPQTAETCSSSATLNEEPQPQAATTLGFDDLEARALQALLVVDHRAAHERQALVVDEQLQAVALEHDVARRAARRTRAGTGSPSSRRRARRRAGRPGSHRPPARPGTRGPSRHPCR